MSKVTSKLQVTLPKAIAAAHNIGPGSEIQFEAGVDCIRIVTGPAKAAVSTDEKLRLLREARERQQQRNKGYERPAKSSRRGWKRQDLYRRGSTN